MSNNQLYEIIGHFILFEKNSMTANNRSIPIWVLS